MPPHPNRRPPLHPCLPSPPARSGLLLHVTSLPSPYGIGDLGPAAYAFADVLARTHQRIWQVLPLGPIGYGHSPYSSPSTFAGNPLFVSPERLVDDGLLTSEDLADAPDFPQDRVDFDRVLPFRRALLEKAYRRHAERPDVRAEAFGRFREQNADWLGDYALFMALKEALGGAWTDWPQLLALRHEEALHEARERHAEAVQMHEFWQWLFAEQWAALKAYCNERQIALFGDIPIYVAHDSADVWANAEQFFLDEGGRPTVVSGVPPDYFSETGQRWGNPIYRWDKMQAEGYTWWKRRMASVLSQVDLVRLDHFRAFAAYWEIPAKEETAINGRWVDGPGGDLFGALRDALGALPVVAEDLGVITPDVRALMAEQGFPGMAVLLFAFGGDPASPFLPHNHLPAQVAYTGTHDNDTVAGWWRERQSTEDAEAVEESRQFTRAYLDLDQGREADVHWAFVRTLMGSVARTAIAPVQDLLGLGNEARMNTPGQGQGNWGWRLQPGQLTPDVEERLRHLTELYDRVPDEVPELEVREEMEGVEG